MVGLLKVLVLVGELIPVIGNVLAILGKRKAQKKLKQTEEILTAVVQGVNKYTSKPTAIDDPSIKQVIQKIASVKPEVEARLNTFVKEMSADN